MFFLFLRFWMQAQAGPPATVPPAVQPTPTAGVTAAAPDSTARVPALSVKAAAGRFGLSVTTSPETVTVGRHFTVTVRVRVPAALGSTIHFPAGVDTTRQELTSNIGSLRRHDVVTGGIVEATATYHLAAWDVGVIPIGLSDLVIGSTHINLADPVILVRSVLPKSALARAKATPKATRPVFSLLVIVRRMVRQAAQSRPMLLFVILLLLIALGVLVWLEARRRQAAELRIDWLKWTEEEFERVEALHLVEKGEPEKYAILMTNIVREFLVHQFPTIRASATTYELAAVLRSEPSIPAERMLDVLARIDMLKFAAASSDLKEAHTVGVTDRALVREIEERRQAQLAAQAAATERARGTAA